MKAYVILTDISFHKIDLKKMSYLLRYRGLIEMAKIYTFSNIFNYLYV